jgi:hypothetical protein
MSITPAPQDPIRLGGRDPGNRRPDLDDLSRRVVALEVDDARLRALEDRVTALEQRLGGRPAGVQRVEF